MRQQNGRRRYFGGFGVNLKSGGNVQVGSKSVTMEMLPGHLVKLGAAATRALVETQPSGGPVTMTVHYRRTKNGARTASVTFLGPRKKGSTEQG